MHTGNPVLDAVNVKAALGQFDLLPLQVADLRGPQTVAVGDQDHGRVAMPIAAVLARAVHQPVDLALGEIASLDCQVYDAWYAFLGCRFHADKLCMRGADCLAYMLFLHSRKGRSGCMERIAIAMQDGGTGAGARAASRPHFVLPPNLYNEPPGRGDFSVSNFAGKEAEIDTAFATLAERHAGGLVVQGDLIYTNRRDDLIALAARYAIPTIYMWSEFTAAGGLIAYGNSLAEGYRQVGTYTGRILHGAKPADLPTMQPMRFRFTINLKTAKALGLTIPASLLILADEVIE